MSLVDIHTDMEVVNSEMVSISRCVIGAVFLQVNGSAECLVIAFDTLFRLRD